MSVGSLKTQLNCCVAGYVEELCAMIVKVDNANAGQSWLGISESVAVATNEGRFKKETPINRGRILSSSSYGVTRGVRRGVRTETLLAVGCSENDSEIQILNSTTRGQ
jgi:hypothetical protein